MDHNTWPNTGIGRINPDGSRGSCIACHSKHSFRASVARQPENCGKCHLGPDHPQKEVNEESKHGIAFFTAQVGDGRNAMNILKIGQWVQELADRAGKGKKYRKRIDELLAKPEHRWFKTGGSAATIKLIEEEQRLRNNQ